jgi:hypothetical protein
MRRAALAAVVVAAALVPAGHVRGQAPDMSVPALVSRGTTSEVVRLDPRTLAARPGARVFVGLHDFPWSRSPDGIRAVFGSGRSHSLRFVRLQPLRLEHLLEVDGFVAAVAWVAPRRVLIVVAGRCCPQPLRVLVVDPQRPGRRVLRSQAIGRGALVDAARSERGLVLLVGGQGRLTPTRLVVLDSAGRARARELLPIRAGSRQLRPKLTEYRTPGLAVDRRGARAFVVGGAKLVARVDLRTLAVDYHRLVTRASQQRNDGGGNAIGEFRRALWLDGRLVVTGYDDRVERGNATSEAAGLTLVDPRDWSARVLDPAVRAAARTGDLVVGFGGDEALLAFAADGTERLRVVRSPAGGGVQVRWPYAYRGLDNGYRPHRADIVDLRTGRVARASADGWTALLGDEERLCWC